MTDHVTPWSPFLGPPWTYTQTWRFAMMIANDRAECRHTCQTVRQTTHSTGNHWIIQDKE